ncbi:hypothetical protein YC2023_099057 [Brassica napus]
MGRAWVAHSFRSLLSCYTQVVELWDGKTLSAHRVVELRDRIPKELGHTIL